MIEPVHAVSGWSGAQSRSSRISLGRGSSCRSLPSEGERQGHDGIRDPDGIRRIRLRLRCPASCARGRRGFKDQILGSVALAMLHYSPCPVAISGFVGFP